MGTGFFGDVTAVQYEGPSSENPFQPSRTKLNACAAFAASDRFAANNIVASIANFDFDDIAVPLQNQPRPRPFLKDNVPFSRSNRKAFCIRPDR